ncbi:MAG: hypothetical protein A2X64_02050 [Ignavibacteria bacterium GWF2_33_9]|nr:MAG: hypothetical protein A2X64_02050 [Ignavibacteria bacterium GWF2_33_9]
MIELLIFHFHILVALFAFTKNWQKSSLKDGFQALGLIALIFAIGWALTGSLAYAIWPKEWNTVFFTHSTLSLIMLTIPECFFFYYFFFQDDAPKQEIPNES